VMLLRNWYLIKISGHDYPRASILETYREGKVSGYPDCCIWNFIYLSYGLNVAAGAFMEMVYGEDPEWECFYVRCPKCRGVDPLKITEWVKRGIPEYAPFLEPEGWGE